MLERNASDICLYYRSEYRGKTLRQFWLPKTNSQLHLAFVEWLRQYFIQRQLPRRFNIDILCNMIRQCWISFAITQFLTSIQVNHVQLWRHNHKWVHLQLISKNGRTYLITNLWSSVYIPWKRLGCFHWENWSDTSFDLTVISLFEEWYVIRYISKDQTTNFDFWTLAALKFTYGYLVSNMLWFLFWCISFYSRYRNVF